MALEFNTIGVKLRYAIESSAGTRPTTSYTEIPDIKGTPAIDFDPAKIQVTNLADRFHRFIDGVISVGDDFPFTANTTASLESVWTSMCSAAATAWASGKSTWYEIYIPNFKSFYFAGKPAQLGVGAMNVDSVIESTLHIVPNQIAGWAASST